MLDPEIRHLLTDALRPPDGYRVDVAVATTYTLDLYSLLLAPLAMAAYSTTVSDVAGEERLELLESVRRHASMTTVFVQAGGIHVPAKYPRLAAFVEQSIVEVMPPEGRVFHPKVWVLRFVSPEGGHRHRFICLSRNLTMDRSWDISLVMDENPDAKRVCDAEPIGAFLTSILAAADSKRPMKDQRKKDILSLADTIRRAKLEVPEPFDRAEIFPFGYPSSASWRFPDQVDKFVVISPFLDAGAIAKLPSARKSMLLSRVDACDRVGRDCLARFDTVNVLRAGTDNAEDAEEGVQHTTSHEVHSGLHAKVIAWDTNSRGFVLTGSTNCTTAAFGGNVEVSVLLEGPKSAVGAGVLWGDDVPLNRLMEEYQPSNIGPADDAAYAAEQRIANFHLSLAAAGLTLSVFSNAEGSFAMSLKVDRPVALVGTTLVRPLGVAAAATRLFEEPWPSWDPVGLDGLSPFLVVETTLSSGDVKVSRACVLVVDLVGAPNDRTDRIFRAMLARGDDLLRYLALLLGDPAFDGLIPTNEDGESESNSEFGNFRPGFDDPVLLEPLVRAVARGGDALERVHAELAALKDDDGNIPQLGEDFLSLWQVVWEAGVGK